MKKERRKHSRRRIADRNVFVVDRCSGKVATLRDLSAGGMQLSYSPGKTNCDQWTSTDIYTDEPNQILIAGLVCEKVYDVASLTENDSFSGTDVRNCGVRFEGLTDAQKDNLEKLFISSATA